jgi:hypothetical protein
MYKESTRRRGPSKIYCLHEQLDLSFSSSRPRLFNCLSKSNRYAASQASLAFAYYCLSSFVQPDEHPRLYFASRIERPSLWCTSLIDRSRVYFISLIDRSRVYFTSLVERPRLWISSLIERPRL